MIVTLFIVTLTLANALEQKKDDIDAEIKTIIGNYISKIPDVESQYVINEGLSKVISQYFKGKITMFPLYKISLKIDRTPVKIPWTLGTPGQGAPVQGAPVQSAPVQGAPVQDAPVQDAPVQGAPVQDAPVQDAPVQGAPGQGAPHQIAPEQTQSNGPADIIFKYVTPGKQESAIKL